MTHKSRRGVRCDDDEGSANGNFQRQSPEDQKRGNDQEAAAHAQKTREAANREAGGGAARPMAWRLSRQMNLRTPRNIRPATAIMSAAKRSSKTGGETKWVS